MQMSCSATTVGSFITASRTAGAQSKTHCPRRGHLTTLIDSIPNAITP